MVIKAEEKKLKRLIGWENKRTVLQLASCDPKTFCTAVERINKLYAPHYFSEINLNCGCPSQSLQDLFGAALMKSPSVVGEIMKEAEKSFPDISFSVKCRIGVNEKDKYEDLEYFVDSVCEKMKKPKVIVHARKALLSGLSPKKNRVVPPLHYDYVYRIAHDRPDIHFTLNGGILSVEHVRTHFDHLPINSHIMIGRAVYDHPFLLYHFLREYDDEWKDKINQKVITMNDFRTEVIKNYLTYVEHYIHQLHLSDPQNAKFCFSLIQPLMFAYQGHNISSLRNKLNNAFRPNTPLQVGTFSKKVNSIIEDFIANAVQYPFY